MDKRGRAVRELVTLALATFAVVIAIVAVALWFTGQLTLAWLARGILVITVAVGWLEFLVLRRAGRAVRVRGPMGGWRRADRMPHYVLAALLTLVILLLGLTEVLALWLGGLR